MTFSSTTRNWTTFDSMVILQSGDFFLFNAWFRMWQNDILTFTALKPFSKQSGNWIETHLLYDIHKAPLITNSCNSKISLKTRLNYPSVNLKSTSKHSWNTKRLETSSHKTLMALFFRGKEPKSHFKVQRLLTQLLQDNLKNNYLIYKRRTLNLLLESVNWIQCITHIQTNRHSSII